MSQSRYDISGERDALRILEFFTLGWYFELVTHHVDLISLCGEIGIRFILDLSSLEERCTYQQCYAFRALFLRNFCFSHIWKWNVSALSLIMTSSPNLTICYAYDLLYFGLWMRSNQQYFCMHVFLNVLFHGL